LDHQAPLKLAQNPPGRRHTENKLNVPLTLPGEAAKETMNAKRATRIGSARRSGFAIFFSPVLVAFSAVSRPAFNPQLSNSHENEEDFSNA
jgi:hypothetical protein